LASKPFKSTQIWFKSRLCMACLAPGINVEGSMQFNYAKNTRNPDVLSLPVHMIQLSPAYWQEHSGPSMV
jgi:hypothetical protein